MNNEIIILEKIKSLPDDIIKIIEQFIPKKVCVFLNNTFYKKYHFIIKYYILHYENYIRYIIRSDSDFIFNHLLIENCDKWLTIKKYNYKNILFNNYLNFIMYYCIDNESTKCRLLLINYMKEEGLCKNLHKKNIIKHIRWKN